MYVCVYICMYIGVCITCGTMDCLLQCCTTHKATKDDTFPKKTAAARSSGQP